MVDGYRPDMYEISANTDDSTSPSLIKQTKFYGRKNERAQLRDAFGRIEELQVILCRGYSGTGKTRLIVDFQESVSSMCYFICAKYDENAVSDPFAALTRALTDLCTQILQQTPEEIARIRHRIIQATGNEVRFLIDMVPKLEQVVGRQQQQPSRASPSSRTSSATASVNRLKYLLERFLQSIGTDERPLVLFLDDLQWANEAALDLLAMLLISSSLKYFAFVGNYRDDDESERKSDLQDILLEALQKQGTAVTTITLGNLKYDELCQLVADMLNCSQHMEQQQVDELATVVYEKTQGNVFFTWSLLQLLVDKSILEFSHVTCQWAWDLKRIQQEMQHSDNVVSLVMSRLKALHGPVQRLLTIAAFLPSTFQVPTLDFILRYRDEAIDKELIVKYLDAAVAVGLLENTIGTPTYRFSHDKVQQAALGLLGDEETDQMGLSIGMALTELSSEAGAEEWVFFVGVEILNSIPPNLSLDPLKLMQLNFASAKLSATSAAYSVAVKYFDKAIICIQTIEVRWEKHYDVCILLYQGAAEASFCIGDYQKGEDYCHEALANARTENEKLPIYGILSDGYGTQERHTESIKIDTKILKVLGQYPRGAENILFTIVNIEKMKRKLLSMTDEELISLPKLEDTKILTAMYALCRLVIRARYVGRTLLIMQCALKILRLSFQHGVAEPTPFAIMAFGAWTFTHLGEHEMGRRFLDLALVWLDRMEAKIYAPSIVYASIAYVDGWSKPWTELMKRANNSFESGMASGAVEFSLVLISTHNVLAMSAGMPLGNVLEDDKLVMSTLMQYQLQSIRGIFSAIHEYLFVLTGVIDEPLRWAQMECYTKRSIEPSQYIKFDWCYFMRMQIAYFFGDLQLAEKNMKYSRIFMAEPHFLKVVLNPFFTCLISTARYRETKRIRYKRKAMKAIKQLKRLASMSPHFVHKVYLLEAEISATFLRKTQSHEIKSKFEKAITMSNRAGFVQDGALASELAGEYFVRCGDVFWANFYFTKAVGLYTDWGATAKAEYLKISRAAYIERRVGTLCKMRSSRKPRYELISRASFKSIQSSGYSMKSGEFSLGKDSLDALHSGSLGSSSNSLSKSDECESTRHLDTASGTTGSVPEPLNNEE